MSWNDDVAYAMTPNKFLTLPLGVWPLQKYNIFSLVRFIVCISSMIMMLIISFLEVSFSSDDAYVKLDALVVVSCNVCCVLKLLSLRLHAGNLIHNFSSAVNDYLAIDTEEKRTIMRRHAFMGRIICYSTISVSYMVSSIYIIVPMMTDGEDVQVNVSKNPASELPIPLTWTLGDVHISTSLYFLISMVQYILFVLICTSDCGGDSLFLGITLHVCGQMELLKIEFINYGSKSKNINDDFLKLASRHYYLMKNAKLLGDVMKFVFLVQMLSSCCYICIIGLQFILALKSHDAVSITKTITIFVSLLLQLSFYSFVGDYLKCQMEEVADSIYSCNWYCLSVKLMRNVLFVIMRSQQPVQLLAGGLFPVNIKTYMTIVKSSLSYLSVLRVMMNT